jgi:hypothetical protein
VITLVAVATGTANGAGATGGAGSDDGLVTGDEGDRVAVTRQTLERVVSAEGADVGPPSRAH